MGKRVYFSHATTGAGAETVFDKDINTTALGQPLRYLYLEGIANSCYVNFDGSAATLDGTASRLIRSGDKFESPSSHQIGEEIPKISIIRSGANNARVEGHGYL